MPPRLYEIRTPTSSQQTPAPILQTRKGQYPNLPNPLSSQCFPPSTTPLQQIPIPEWHTLNPNKSLTSTNLLPALSELPNSSPSTKLEQYAGNPGITFLSLRSPSSTTTITNTPGKALSITTSLPSATLTFTPADIASLHKVLGTDFLTAPSDHPPLHSPQSSAKLSRHTTRATQLRAEVGNPEGLLPSIVGGDSVTHRLLSARDAPPSQGYSIDGLYAGESPERRLECIKAVASALPEGFRVLSGGSGAPWEVLSAVRKGIDLVDANYPFEIAAEGYACDIKEGRVVNLRDRKWLTCPDIISPECGCLVCRQGFSRAYLRHLFEVHEIMAVSFVTAHNIWDYHVWFERLREAIKEGRFEEFVEEFEKARAREREGGT